MLLRGTSCGKGIPGEDRAGEVVKESDADMNSEKRQRANDEGLPAIPRTRVDAPFSNAAPCSVPHVGSYARQAQTPRSILATAIS